MSQVQFYRDLTPLQYLLSKLGTIEGGTKIVSVADLLQKGESNVIVLDGYNFYGQYIYPKFNWACGGLKELEELVSSFVLAFEKVGAKLVFFFVDGHIDEGKRDVADRTWLKERSKYAEYTVKFFEVLKKRHNINDHIKTRDYYHTPFHALSVVLHVLRFVLNCEVHIVKPGHRNDLTAYYARDNKCLALLADDKYYLFYSDLPHYLSMKHINLKTMTTKLYNPEVLPSYFGISKKYLLPEAIKLLNGNNSKFVEDTINTIIGKFKTCVNMNIYDEKYDDDDDGNNDDDSDDADENDQDDTDDNCTYDKQYIGHDFPESDKRAIIKMLEALYLRFVKGYKFINMYGPFQKWGLIRQRATELNKTGLMSRKIKLLLRGDPFYNDSILEDFSEFPPSSYLYQPLRRKLYQILFYEAPENKFIEIKELCMTDKGCKIEKVSLEALDTSRKNVHPGLLELWDSANVTDDIETKKWKLFSHSISFQLGEEIQTLPPTLVIPTVVLFYLCQIIPSVFKNYSKMIESWEVDVFIVQALMLSQMTADCYSKIKITMFNARALKLIAQFTYGCLTMQLLMEVCGNVLKKSDVCLAQYFDGKLFHHLYEKAGWRRNALSELRDEAAIQTFHKIRHIILCE